MEVITNLIGILDAFWGPVRIVAILLGYLLIGIGLFTFAMGHSGKGSQLYPSTMMLVAGFLLVSLDSFLDVASYSLLDQNTEMSALGYSTAGKSDTAILLVFSFAAIKFLGLIAGIKGIWTLYSHSTEQSQSIFTALLYLFLAVVGLNFAHFLDILGASLGGTIGSSIDKLLDF